LRTGWRLGRNTISGSSPLSACSQRVFSGVETSPNQTTTQTKPTAPVMMKDQRHDSVAINQATAGAPSASPRLDPPERQ